ncbi:Hypothetical predicted protein [Marmota monax]|uniref:Uncharacterized protein n=1 Tax=Marmota monax TaxID=9995 RepID=A0A5E4A0I8_MARMO|nr:Hypothetical predicted protein [Marmota monax]
MEPGFSDRDPVFRDRYPGTRHGRSGQSRRPRRDDVNVGLPSPSSVGSPAPPVSSDPTPKFRSETLRGPAGAPRSLPPPPRADSGGCGHDAAGPGGGCPPCHAIGRAPAHQQAGPVGSVLTDHASVLVVGLTPGVADTPVQEGVPHGSCHEVDVAGVVEGRQVSQGPRDTEDVRSGQVHPLTLIPGGRDEPERVGRPPVSMGHVPRPEHDPYMGPGTVSYRSVRNVVGRVS